MSDNFNTPNTDILIRYNHLLQAIERHNWTKLEFDEKIAKIVKSNIYVEMLVNKLERSLERLEKAQQKIDTMINIEQKEGSRHRKVCDRNCLMVEQHLKYCGLDIDES
jgi:hypothetical protein